MQFSNIFKFKTQFKHLNFYSIPTSILLIVRKRLNLVFSLLTLILVIIYTIF